MTRLVLLIFISFYLVEAVQAQERAKIRHDYFLNPTGQYSPDDPWTRSRIWRRHTGHWGRFYNCDCEEQKRYSPYICWKNAECPYVGESWRHRWQRDRARIWQRINDGSCNECTNQTVGTCSCPQCSNQLVSTRQKTQPEALQIAKQSSLLTRLTAGDERTVRHAEPNSLLERLTQSREASSESRVAEKSSLLERLHSQHR